MTRQQQALGEPPGDLTGFPRAYVRPARTVYRAHARGSGPWWFSGDQSGRFDLAAPRGTCYLASTATTALRERWGRNLVRQGLVSAPFADQTVVSALRVPHSNTLANVTVSRAATFGITREVNTIVPYDLPQRWASAFERDGFAGVQYEARFSTGANDRAYAVFADAGEHGWPADRSPVAGSVVAIGAGIAVVGVPTSVTTEPTPP